MKAKTVILGASIGIGVASAAYLVGMGIGATTVLLEEEVKKQQKEKASKTQKPKGPKAEQVRNPIKRNKTNKQFEDIVDKY